MKVVSLNKTGKNIRKLIKKNNMKQTQLANALDVTDMAVHKWINCQSLPSIDNIMIMSGIFNCKIEDIVGYDEV